MEEHRLRVFENRMLRMFELERDDLMGNSRKLQVEF
jgi:hypothetical protein